MIPLLPCPVYGALLVKATGQQTFGASAAKGLFCALKATQSVFPLIARRMYFANAGCQNAQLNWVFIGGGRTRCFPKRDERLVVPAQTGERAAYAAEGPGQGEPIFRLARQPFCATIQFESLQGLAVSQPRMTCTQRRNGLQRNVAPVEGDPFDFLEAVHRVSVAAGDL